MRPVISFRFRPVLGLLFVAATLVVSGTRAVAQEDKSNKAEKSEKKVKVPDELMGDEHMREEFGINEFTTPSIRKIFDQLDALGTLPYDSLKRPILDKAPSDRVLLSLGLGMLIGDGFLIVQCEKIEEMENVGRSLLKYAKALGAGMRIGKHSQSLLENSLKGDWDSLRLELASTQSDVEAEMVLLRDADVAHLISLGGWLRAFEISTETVAENFSDQKSQELKHGEVVDYFVASLETFHPEIQSISYIKDIHDGLVSLRPMLDAPEGKGFTLEQVKDLRDKAHLLALLVRENLPKK